VGGGGRVGETGAFVEVIVVVGARSRRGVKMFLFWLLDRIKFDWNKRRLEDSCWLLVEDDDCNND
jgi:hypothetical protein